MEETPQKTAKPEPPAPAVSPRARWALLTSIGIMFPVSITLGAAFGYLLDRRLGTLPWLSAVFLGFGVAAAFVNLFRMLDKFEKLDTEAQGSKPSPPGP
jgi:F0F1-type ATP synthase assembly protein I